MIEEQRKCLNCYKSKSSSSLLSISSYLLFQKTITKRVNRNYLYSGIKITNVFEKTLDSFEFYIKMEQIYYPTFALDTYRCINHNRL